MRTVLLSAAAAVAVAGLIGASSVTALPTGSAIPEKVGNFRLTDTSRLVVFRVLLATLRAAEDRNDLFMSFSHSHEPHHSASTIQPACIRSAPQDCETKCRYSFQAAARDHVTVDP